MGEGLSNMEVVVERTSMMSIHLYRCPHPHLREVSITEFIARVGAWWILPFVNIGSTGARLIISTALKELGQFWSMTKSISC